MKTYKEDEIKYLNLLSEKFPTIQDACAEIINLQAILNLPKATEHFLSDLHGEYESFTHILKNASGVIRAKIEDTLGTSLTTEEQKKLATLIYYPEEKIKLIKNEVKDINEFYKITLYRLILICREVSSKYSRSKVRKAMPKGYEYIIDELLHSNSESSNKDSYYDEIINTIIELNRADAFIIAISKLIQHLAVDHLHIIGDIYDRGPGPHIILDELMKYHSIDIQWGNHDIIWMGASSGSAACIFNVIRICARYDNLDILEDVYGINIRPLTEFAVRVYKDQSGTIFRPKESNNLIAEDQADLLMKMQKAASIIEFKIEAEVIKNHPEFEMEDRLLLDKIDYENGTIEVDGKKYKLEDTYFPTIDPKNPYKLTNEEEEIVNKIVKAFKNSDKLQRHIKFLYDKGNIYKVFNGNLLIHGCIPMNSKGEFVGLKVKGEMLVGKKFLEYVEKIARQGYFAPENSKEKKYGEDFLWYLWCGASSPIFCKHAMKTFERYFVTDEELRKEIKNPFYKFVENEKYCEKVFKEFGLNNESSHIICGHIPVKFKAGESPIKANGKMLIIDGGLSKAYQKTTGIAGYTLIYNSYGLMLAAHEPFTSIEDAIVKETDLRSTTRVVEKVDRKKIADTDIGIELRNQISDLEELLEAYNNGIVNEKNKT